MSPFVEGFAKSDDLYTPACGTLAVDDLTAVRGCHAGAETEFAGTFYFADTVGVMHENLSNTFKMPGRAPGQPHLVSGRIVTDS